MLSTLVCVMQALSVFIKAKWSFEDMLSQTYSIIVSYVRLLTDMSTHLHITCSVHRSSIETLTH